MALCLREERNPNPLDEPTSPVNDLIRHWKGKAKAQAPPSRHHPLTILDLPIDLLNIIVAEVAKADRAFLLSLIRVNSTFHNLVIPNLYSLFDIVWPEEDVVYSDSGTDALVAGLCTLAHGSLFLQTMRMMRRSPSVGQKPLEHEYAQFIRRFSISNGPESLVKDFSLSTDTGRMVNTLLALAMRKMTDLEVFKWDLGSGLSSEVFMALAMLGHAHCNLREVWVRWHDHSAGVNTPSSSSSSSSRRTSVASWDQPPPPGILAAPNPPPAVQHVPSASSDTSSAAAAAATGGQSGPGASSNKNTPTTGYFQVGIEYPTFSVLPPLESIAVLDVDLVSYLDELSVLVERSRHTLRELRIGVSETAKREDFVKIAGAPENPQQIDHEATWPGQSTIGNQRLGGVLGIVLSRLYDIRSNSKEAVEDAAGVGAGTAEGSEASASVNTGNSGGVRIRTESGHWAPRWINLDNNNNNTDDDDDKTTEQQQKTDTAQTRPRDLAGKLALHRLELERVHLHKSLCVNAFDWSVLTSLTMLQCPKSDGFWKALRHQYKPTLTEGFSRHRASSGKRPPKERWQYHLALKSVHVDITTFHLVKFLKETVAPNTLEVLFLQDRRHNNIPPVPLGLIFEGLVKRHTASLSKLLLCSSHIDFADSLEDDRRMWWALTSEMTMWVTSQRMSRLRELAVSLDPQSWHLLLQRLPNIPKIKSVNIPSIISNRLSGASRELGQQFINVITLRPEIQLRFLGIYQRCFEIVESSHHGPPGSDSDSFSSISRSPSGSPRAPSSAEAPDVDDEDELPSAGDGSDGESHSSRGDASDDVSSHVPDQAETAPSFKLHEISFYDDKVAIFKARHGKL